MKSSCRSLGRTTCNYLIVGGEAKVEIIKNILAVIGGMTVTSIIVMAVIIFKK